MNIIDFVKHQQNKFENEMLTNELKHVCMQRTLSALANYVLKSELEETGLLLTQDDLEFKTQKIFWEWKNEKLIDEYNMFNQTTSEWIYDY